MSFYVPEGYKPQIDLKETQVAIKTVKDFFQKELTKQLNLTRVSAPLFVTPESGLNDNLNGVERPVSFDMKEGHRQAEIVHSLAKWKRFALKQYGFKPGEGLYTDMNAIRRDEDTDNIHSIYVDQWDWEKVITKEERTRETLEAVVTAVYKALKITEDYLAYEYDYIGHYLPEHIKFITAQESSVSPGSLRTDTSRRERSCSAPESKRVRTALSRSASGSQIRSQEARAFFRVRPV